MRPNPDEVFRAAQLEIALQYNRARIRHDKNAEAFEQAVNNLGTVAGAVAEVRVPVVQTDIEAAHAHLGVLVTGLFGIHSVEGLALS